MMNIHVHTKCIYARLTALYENNVKHIHIEIHVYILVTHIINTQL